jgi:protein phosphatase PTC2/3
VIVWKYNANNKQLFLGMEDAHATVLNLDEKKGDEKASFFGVYDGHGGSTVAKFTGETLHTRLAATDEYKSGKYEEALKRAFLATDEDLRANPSFANDPSGCTSVVALLVAGPTNDTQSKQEKTARRILVANAGDSRSVLGLAGEAKAMSQDHKPGNKTENARIVSAGGFVEFGRVNGNLALSRAIGDFEFKQNFSLEPEQQIVTADPEIINHSITGEEEFLVLACDGIWDCLSSQQVVDFVRRQIANGKELKAICEEAIDRCLAPDSQIGGVGCDNMTICIVALLNGKTKEEWYAWVKDRVEKKVGWETPEDIAPVFSGQSNNSGLSVGGLGGMGGGSVLSALAGNLGAGGEDDERDGQQTTLRLPGGLAGALGGAGIVFRPGNQTDENGDVVYEAHVVDQDEDSDEEMQTAQVSELEEAGENEATKRQANNQTGRSDLEHQPEIVESPSSAASATKGNEGASQAHGIRSSTEGSKATEDTSSTSA